MFRHINAQLIEKGPSLLKASLKITPDVIKRGLVERLINWQFSQALCEGELAFLQGRWLKVDVRDLGLSWLITLQQDKLRIGSTETADVTFSANTNDLILIAARKEDPDTLFFQRRLMIEGDTELGLYVKNLIDSIELETMPAPLRVGLMQLASLIENSLTEGVGNPSRASLHAD